MTEGLCDVFALGVSAPCNMVTCVALCFSSWSQQTHSGGAQAAVGAFLALSVPFRLLVLVGAVGESGYLR